MTRSKTGEGPTTEELVNDQRSPDDVLTYGMGYSQQRYSPLAQINKSNVKRLVPVWSLALQNEFGEQAQPMIYDGVMYVADAKWTVAVDAATGNTIWRTPTDFVPETPRVVCCGVSNKGVALYRGKVFRTTLDAFVVALDQKTGKVLWKEKAAEWKDGYSQTVAPQIANGVVITGISGAEFGIRGFLDGWDPDTGKHLWRLYTTPGPGEKGHVDRRYGAVERTAAVIRHDHAIGACIDGRPCLIATQNAFDDELARPEVAEFTNVVPGHRLERPRTRSRLAIENGVAVTVGKIRVGGHAFVHDVLAHDPPHPAGMSHHVHGCRHVRPERKRVAVALVVLASAARRGVDRDDERFPTEIARPRDHLVGPLLIRPCTAAALERPFLRKINATRTSAPR